MSIRIMNWVWHTSQACGVDRLVLLAIADRANDEGYDAWPSIANLVAKTKVSKRTVQRSLRTLAEIGELVCQPQIGPGRANVYRIVMDARPAPTHTEGDNLTPSPRPQARTARNFAPTTPPTRTGVNVSPSAAPRSAAVSEAGREPAVPPASDAGRVSGCHPHGVTLAPSGCQADAQTVSGWHPIHPVRTSTSGTSSTTAAGPRLDPATVQNPNGNYRVIERLALALLEHQTFEDEGAFVEAVKTACARHRIDYGHQVASDVVHRACASARVIRLKGGRRAIA